jgi:hypothetical protein
MSNTKMINIEEIAANASLRAKKEATKMRLSISDYSLEVIHKHFLEHKEDIENSLLQESKSISNIDKSIVKLIEAASLIARTYRRENIIHKDIEMAMKRICPTYWPFC